MSVLPALRLPSAFLTIATTRILLETTMFSTTLQQKEAAGITRLSKQPAPPKLYQEKHGGPQPGDTGEPSPASTMGVPKAPSVPMRHWSMSPKGSSRPKTTPLSPLGGRLRDIVAQPVETRDAGTSPILIRPLTWICTVVRRLLELPVGPSECMRCPSVQKWMTALVVEAMKEQM